MIKEEIVRRSPFRILERSIHNGLGRGNIGLVAAHKGVGKTACLVHLATDQLFQGKHVLHVSFSPDTSHIIAWYEDIFKEIAQRYALEGAMDIHDEVVRRRIILNFRQEVVSARHVHESMLSIVNDARFTADLAVIDGYDFTKSNETEFHLFKELAETLDIELWFSATLRPGDRQCSDRGIPLPLEPFMGDTAILIMLNPREDYIHLNLVKDHEVMPNCDLHLKLDPHILLIADER
ncbi:MAG: hypothetical protein JXA18_00070 [Chitinispirillaceae bacterium]|nr:hypothetical protein [Chitinispirillaceae bacterium]